MERFPESEADKTKRVLKVVQTPSWDFLQSLGAINGNPFYNEPEAYKTPVVTEIRPRPLPPPDYEPPQSDAIAA